MAGVPETPTVSAEAARLELHRVAAFEDQVEARLTLGRHAGMVDELRRVIKEHPFRERMVGQLMLALYRCGRPLDALETYRQGRRLCATSWVSIPDPRCANWNTPSASTTGTCGCPRRSGARSRRSRPDRRR